MHVLLVFYVYCSLLKWKRCSFWWHPTLLRWPARLVRDVFSCRSANSTKLLQSRVCAYAQRTGAATRKSLRYNCPGGLMSSACNACDSASRFLCIRLSQQYKQSSFINPAVVLTLWPAIALKALFLYLVGFLTVRSYVYLLRMQVASEPIGCGRGRHQYRSNTGSVRTSNERHKDTIPAWQISGSWTRRVRARCLCACACYHRVRHSTNSSVCERKNYCAAARGSLWWA